MEEKSFYYSFLYKFNYVPGMLFILFLLILVIILPSTTTKIYGYIFIICLLTLYLTLLFNEKKKVAMEIRITAEGIVAKKLLSKDVTIKWDDIKTLLYTGQGLFVMPHKYLYAEIIDVNDMKIVVRREIIGFNDLIDQIQQSTGLLFQFPPSYD